MALNSVLYERIGAKLSELRKLNQLTQEDLAMKIGVKRATISNIEAGRQQISLHLLYKIAAEFHTEVSTILPSHNELNSLMNKKEVQIATLLDEQNISDITKNSILQSINKDSHNGT